MGRAADVATYVANLVQEWIDEDKGFTAYDVTVQVRNDLNDGAIRHSDVRSAVHALMVQPYLDGKYDWEPRTYDGGEARYYFSRKVARKPASVNWIGVISSWIDAIGFDPDRYVLHVALADKTRYSYKDVTSRTFIEFLNSDSKGQYFNDNIKGQYVQLP